MALYRGGLVPSAIYRGDQPVSVVYRGDTEVWRSGPPVVYITGTSGTESRDQFRAACTQYGVNYQTVQVLPFLLDTSQATNLSLMFYGCSSLTTVPDLDTSQVQYLNNMFYNCSSLTSVPDLETSQATNLAYMFTGCSLLTTVPDLETSQATNLAYMFWNCSSLTDGNVRCIGRHPSADTTDMITGSGLTREPFYDTNGNPLLITVTPQAPTFLTESPWYTLPTQTGVTYTVSGTPGYSQTVTVTATPQAGYELTGQTSWTHTYGPAPSIYPVSGTWGPTFISTSYSTYATHTIAESGTFTITHTVRAESGFARSATARISGPWGDTTGATASSGATSTASTSRTLPSGAVVEFRATGVGNTTGSWSIVKN